MNIDEAKQLLKETMEAKFKDKTFRHYINESLAGDFAVEIAVVIQSLTETAHLFRNTAEDYANKINKLRAKLERLENIPKAGCCDWKAGFVCGYVCAAANVVRTHDLPTVALDLLKEGIGKEDISAVDEGDIETLVNSDSRIAAYLGRGQLSSAVKEARG